MLNAMIEKSDNKHYDKDNQLHMEGGPTVEQFGFFRSWINGQLHRLDGPAIEYADGTKEWYINGKRHREDGPAVEDVNGHKEWYINGKLHRLDGPAVEYANGDKYWYYQGQLINCQSQEEFELWLRKENLKCFW